MSTQEIGWKFPPTGGGEAAGWNHPGIAHFRGHPVDSLARETIQNSLDARGAQLFDPVHVSFELKTLAWADLGGRAELERSVSACLAAVDGDDKAESALQTAAELLCRDEITFLHVSDRNTTGLYGNRWETLVRRPGTSLKDMRGAGGSQGIGKYSPFAVSPLRTVYYWTRYELDGGPEELFQGKAILMSHLHSGEETQGIGFFGIRESCQRLSGGAIPAKIQAIEDGIGDGPGTSLWIAGFDAGSDWRRRVGRSVVANYFTAIQHELLAVTIEPEEQAAQEEWMLEINADTLGYWFEYLVGDDGMSTEDAEALREARLFWELIGTDEPTVIKDPPDPDLGAPKLWITVDHETYGEDLPNKVALIRGAGMLITAQQNRIGNFRNLRDYAAVCLFDASDDDANEFLREMEGPQHNQFESERMDDPERGDAALERLRKWIREQLGEYAAAPRVEVSEEITELAHLLPLDAPGPFKQGPRAADDAAATEKAFGEMGAVRVKQIKARAQPLQLDDEDDDDAEGGDGTDVGGAGGSSEGDGQGGKDGGGAGDGDTDGGTGSRGGGRGATPIEVRDVRVLPVEGYEDRCRVSFTPSASGSVRLHIEEAGDSTALKRPDLKVFVGGIEQQISNFPVAADERVTLEIRGDEPLRDRAWRVVALKESTK